MTVKKINKGIDKILEPIINLEDDMWEKVIEKYESTKKEQVEIFKDILVDGFKTTEDEYEMLVDKVNGDVYEHACEHIKKCVSADLAQHLLRKFKKMF